MVKSYHIDQRDGMNMLMFSWPVDASGFEDHIRMTRHGIAAESWFQHASCQGEIGLNLGPCLE